MSAPPHNPAQAFDADRVKLVEHDAPEWSDEFLALRFAERHQGDVRFVSAWNKWMLWDGMRWAEDETRKGFDLSRDVCRAASKECNTTAAKNLASAKTVRAVHTLARVDRRIAATTDQWDADPWILNTPRGILDLRTGDLRPNKPTDYHTKLTAVTPDGKCPRWHDFLDRAMDGDNETTSFLQRMVGYCLTGSVRDHAMFFLYDSGANGKSVFLNTVAGILGDYARPAPIETFTASHTDRHPTELAMLRGARMVTATETEEGRRWAEAKIKALTGGDRISARFMRQDYFEYDPQFKLIVAGNHKPGLRNVDEAIRRRLNLIPFTVTIPEDERDETLSETLKAEWPGILNWALEGCLDWQERGFAPPESVTSATAEYFDGQDTFSQWIEERCTTVPTAEAKASALYANWKEWAEDAGEFIGSQRRFSQGLEDRGFCRQRRMDARMFAGIALKN